MKEKTGARQPGEIYRDFFNPARGTWRVWTHAGPWPCLLKTKKAARMLASEYLRVTPFARAAGVGA